MNESFITNLPKNNIANQIFERAGRPAGQPATSRAAGQALFVFAFFAPTAMADFGDFAT